MSKRSLVSVVEDDQFFRESMRRLMRSLGYKVEVFASAADFLASCVYRKLKLGRSGGEVRPGWRVN